MQKGPLAPNRWQINGRIKLLNTLEKSTIDYKILKELSSEYQVYKKNYVNQDMKIHLNNKQIIITLLYQTKDTNGSCEKTGRFYLVIQMYNYEKTRYSKDDFRRFYVELNYLPALNVLFFYIKPSLGHLDM